MLSLMKKVIGVIPARWQSRRFPGKPLANILGKSLIYRTFANASRSQTLDALVIATDDLRIFNHAKEWGAEVFMTSTESPTGTDCVWEVVDRHFPDAEVIVNIQGDEPCLDPHVIDQLVARIRNDQDVLLTTAVTKIEDDQIVNNPNAVKCVFDKRGRALYFSRSPIPFAQKQLDSIPYYRHLGIYCFRRHTLKEYVSLNKTPLQESENLEQLKMLENGLPIHVSIVDEQAIGVDTPEDVKTVEKILCQKRNICSLPEELSPLWVKD